MDYNPAEQQHYVLVCIGTADEACEPLPLVEFPDAYQVGRKRNVALGLGVALHASAETTSDNSF